MSTYSYSAVNALGQGTRGTLQANDQSEALERIKEMGFFPTRVAELRSVPTTAARALPHSGSVSKSRAAAPGKPLSARIKARQLSVFTRQLSTLLQAGMPLLRSLRLLHEQETDPRLRAVIAVVSETIEGGSSFSEALAQFPRIFDRLYLNMIKAGEISGSLEVCLQRLAQFMEKSQRIKGKVRTAMFYPASVITVALAVIAIMLIFVVPRFETVFKDLNNGAPLPIFTQIVLGISKAAKDSILYVVAAAAVVAFGLRMALRSRAGRWTFDGFKLRMPILGTLFRKLAISRFMRTLGTLVTSGVPILQALTIVKEATGNVVVGDVVRRVHSNVEQGESIVGPLRTSGIFPAMVVGMVDVGEQTGALPEMLNRVADNYDEEVDNSVAAMTSLLEPFMIVFLGVVVGSIVVAMYLPLWNFDPNRPGQDDLP